MAITVTRTDPPAAPTVTSIDAVHGWDVCYSQDSGVFTDRTTPFTTPGTDVDSFAANGDELYFSIQDWSTCNRVIHVHIALATFASSTISPVFEYSTGDNSWAAITVTDGTVGFTQDGSILMDLSVLPSTSAWKKATKDGSSNTVGDGTGRVYFRIRRTASTLTTPPQISECGTGVLTASTTYYYRVCSVSSSAIYGAGSSSFKMSAPTAEASATTTAIKRTIQLVVDSGSNGRVIWRTPTSGAYDKGGAGTSDFLGNRTATAYIDSECQTVKGSTYGGDMSSSWSYINDYGVALEANYYSATLGIWGYYKETLYTGVERGDLKIETDGETGNFEDIYDACVSNGWTDALIPHHFTIANGRSQRQKIYTLNDNLSIECIFSAYLTTILLRGVITTYSSSSATFGRRQGSGGNYYYDAGCNFILNQAVSYSGDFYFKNSLFYSCRFTQAAIHESRHYAHFPIFDDNCELYDCVIDGYASLELPEFAGDNIVVRNTILSESRYGLVVNSGVLDTIDIDGFTVQGGTSIYNGVPYWTDGTEVDYKNFTFKNSNPFLLSYSAASNDIGVTLNFINPTFINSSITTSRGGQSWIYNEQYELDLTVLDVDGNAISGATVVLTDSQSSQVFSTTTDSNGQITTQVATYKQYTGGTLYSAGYHQYLADDVTTLSPHILTVSKAGYQTYTSVFDIDEKRGLVVTLQKSVDVFLVEGDGMLTNAEAQNPQNNILLR